MSGASASSICLALLAFLVSSGCASVDPLTGISSRQQDRIDRAVERVAFIYPDCPKAELKVARVSPDGRLIEVSVCGGVRRYQDVSPRNIGGEGGNRAKSGEDRRHGSDGALEVGSSSHPVIPGTFTPRARATSTASEYPASTCRSTPIPGSEVSTRSMRRAAASVPSATMTCPACSE